MRLEHVREIQAREKHKIDLRYFLCVLKSELRLCEDEIGEFHGETDNE